MQNRLELFNPIANPALVSKIQNSTIDIGHSHVDCVCACVPPQL